ncbi:MAG: exodeoxyribonuclease III [Oligosphaeraceae bacterium]|mgnify:CR=1 FL=1|nr:exodeoxyribonuclease III [Oligosphaeraceae bacterium]
MQRIISWNVNGIRACEKKGFLDWLNGIDADCICLQETKAVESQLGDNLLEVPGYKFVLFPAERRGYSGVGTYFRHEPLSLEKMDCAEFDVEGRVMILEYPQYYLLNCYFPNSQPGGARLDYKIAFCDAILEKCRELLAKGKQLLMCGDYNIAHKEIDLARPKENVDSPGFLPEERAWMDKFVAAGFVDSFRKFNSEPGNYTWWSYRSAARERNVGWRIDYHCVNEGFADRVAAAGIQSDVMGSDHCPVYIDLQI